jgi:hypothetical protein
MFSRKSKLKRRAQALADKAADRRVREQLDELGDALEDARDAIARASASAGRKVAGVTAETARQAAGATRDAARSAAESASAGARQAAESTRRASKRQARAARAAAERLGESDLGELPRKAADKLFRERAKERRKERRKRQRRLVYRGAGVAGLGVLVGWLTAPKRGQEARQAIRQQAAKASEKGWEKVAEGRDSDAGQPSAEVTPLHDAAGTGGQPRTPKD